jgi:hypothetical protein
LPSLSVNAKLLRCGYSMILLISEGPWQNPWWFLAKVQKATAMSCWFHDECGVVPSIGGILHTGHWIVEFSRLVQGNCCLQIRIQQCEELRSHLTDCNHATDYSFCNSTECSEGCISSRYRSGLLWFFA